MTVARGTYALVLTLDRSTDIAVGRLGIHRFPSGYYVYVGSALGGLRARVQRHVRGGGKTHWHIDYLRRHAGVVEVWYLVSDVRWECLWYHTVAAMPGALVPVAGFGSSGCGCGAHLAHFASAPSFEGFRLKLGDRGPDLRRIAPDGWGRDPESRYNSFEKNSAAMSPI